MQLSDLDITKTYTYADYLKWAFDERIELIKGKIFEMIPPPGSVHQSRKFMSSKLLTIGDDVITPILPGFTLSLDEFFADRNN